MTISETNYSFWTTLENHLNAKVPIHIKNILNILGYGSAITFKSINDDDIHQIEEYVQSQLQEDLELRFSNDFEKESIFSHFFGKFSCDSSHFVFSPIERAALKSFAYFVKQLVDEPRINAGLHYFEYHGQCIGNFQLQRYFGEVDEELNPEYKTKTHTFLNSLIATANQNVLTNKNGYRFDDETRKFATYVRMLAGPMAYETIQKNLNLALPSLSATNRYISDMHGHLVEGELRCEALGEYLRKRNLPLVVSMSEDATRINGRVQYDPILNELIGFVLPTNAHNGMPIPHSFSARNCDEMIKHFSESNSVANFVNVIMAQPLANVRPFCLLLFSSDNKFTAESVINRWKFIFTELAKVNITVLNFASDSDPRYNSAMRKCLELGHSSDIFANVEWFNSGMKAEPPFFIQDTIHIATKLRNMFLKTKPFPSKLPFGKKYFIQVKHLEFLLENFPKDRHQLTATVLNPMDRQNFSSVERICDDKVIELLEANVPESDGTVMFLKILRHIIESYSDISLTPLERIKKIWYAVFVLRIWRQFISSNGSKKLGDNFLTQNAYTCIEINAHALVFIIQYLRDSNAPTIFLPEKFDSQPCEGFFGQIRSLSTTYSTVVNCSVKEIIARINRIHLQNDIAVNTDFLFPRMKDMKQCPNQVFNELPNDMQIFKQIEESKCHAIRDSIDIGLIEEDAAERITFACQVTPVTIKTKTFKEKVEGNVSVSSILLRREAIVLKNYADKFINEKVSETSSYVEVYQSQEKRIIIKKMSFCWLLRKDCVKLSSDRLIRVRAEIQPTINKRLPLRTVKRINRSPKLTFKINKKKNWK